MNDNETSVSEPTFGRTLTEEAGLGRDIYFSEKYFQRTQLFSQAAQLHEIYQFHPKSILEIGPGNGLVSAFLRSAGFHVDTFDINQDLNPTFVGSVLELENQIAPKCYDLVVCCEVLEHLPFEDLPQALSQLARVARKSVLITLPQAKKWFFSLGGFLQFPSCKTYWFSFTPSFGRTHPIYKNHHWEVGWKKRHSIPELRRLMEKEFVVEQVREEPMKPYHLFFRLSVRKLAKPNL
ncbi:class I SAM-dependent methyltransferase [Gimesia panareensis]|nr:class I SAM-dependent methyltransferase [Gimesia panareensis]